MHRRDNAEENQYVENPHYVTVPLRPQQANPNNTSAASEGGVGGEAGGGSVEARRERCEEAGEGGEAREGDQARGEEHLNPHYCNRLKDSFNQQMEGERPITKVLGMYGNNIKGHS